MPIFPKAMYRFNVIPIKLPIAFFTELENFFTIFVETQKTCISKWEESGSLTSGYTTKLVFKTVWYWHKNRNIGQWSRKESPEITPHTCVQLIYNKGDRNI